MKDKIINIESDGTPFNTKVTNDFGDEYHNICEVNYNVNANDRTKTTLTLITEGSFKLNGQWEMVEVEFLSYKGFSGWWKVHIYYRILWFFHDKLKGIPYYKYKFRSKKK